MPAQPKLFEGPSLEPLLEQIHREVGAEAKILRAEKTREGGVLGFFAREQYRLTVQLPATSGRRKQSAAPKPVQGDTPPRAASAGRSGRPARTSTGATGPAPARSRTTQRAGATSTGTATRPGAGTVAGGARTRSARTAGTVAGGARPDGARITDTFAALADATVDEVDVVVRHAPVMAAQARSAPTAPDVAKQIIRSRPATSVIASGRSEGALSGWPPAGKRPNGRATSPGTFDAGIGSEKGLQPVETEALPGETEALPVETEALPARAGALPLEPEAQPVSRRVLPVDSTRILPVDTDVLLAKRLAEREVPPTDGTSLLGSPDAGQRKPAREADDDRSFDAVLRRVAMALGDDPFVDDPFVEDPASPASPGRHAAAVADDDAVGGAGRSDLDMSPRWAADVAETVDPHAGHLLSSDPMEPDRIGDGSLDGDPSGTFDALPAVADLTEDVACLAPRRRRGAHLATGEGTVADDLGWDLPLEMAADILAVADRLRTAGLPEKSVETIALAGADQEQLGGLLETLFAQLPPPPPLPTLAGAVIAVVGQGRRLRRATRSIARELGISPDDTVVVKTDNPGDAVYLSGQAIPALTMAGDPPATDEDQHAAAWGPPDVSPAPIRPTPATRPPVDAMLTRLARHLATTARPVPVVVAIHSEISGPTCLRAAEVLASLRPAAVWGVVDAVTKPEDIAAWAANLGGVDALLVDNVGGTVSPAAVLRSGVPVARLDGRPATATRWARTIGDLVAA